MADYLCLLLTQIAIVAVLGVGLNASSGYLGYWNFAQAAYFGAGAYATGLAASSGAHPFAAALLAVLLGVAMGTAMGVISLWTRGLYFLLFSIGIQMLCSDAFRMMDLGHRISGAPGLSVRFPGISGRPGVILACCTIVVLSAVMLSRYMLGTPFGRVVLAIRENEQLAVALAKPIRRVKIVVFAFDGGLCALAGWLYGLHIGFVGSDEFGLGTALLVFVATSVAGLGRQWAPLVGSVILVAVSEPLALFASGGIRLAVFQRVTLGVSLLAVVLWRARREGPCQQRNF